MDNKEKEKIIVEKELDKINKELKKSDWMVTLTSTIIKKETYLIENETKEDAKYIATDQNCSPRFKCTKWNTDESDPEFDDEVIAKEVSFELTDDGKSHYWKEKGDANGKN